MANAEAVQQGAHPPLDFVTDGPHVFYAPAEGAGALDAIVTWHNDRLHRSPKELEAFIDLVERCGVRLAVVTGGDHDMTTPDGRLSARIVGAVARKESEDRSRGVRHKHPRAG